MATGTQISAVISVETRERMERYAKAHGIKKAHLVESALLHHLNAMDEIPADLVIPPTIVVTRESGERILDRIENPPEASEALRRLLETER